MNYSLAKRKFRILIFWLLVILDSFIFPIGLYYLLTRTTTWSTTTSTLPSIFALWRSNCLFVSAVFNILTATLLGTFVTESLLRSWSLWRKNSRCRVPNAGRYYVTILPQHPAPLLPPRIFLTQSIKFDFTHWNVLVSWVIIIAELVVGTIPDPPWMRLLALPVPSIFFIFGLEMLVFEALYVFKKPTPFRISSSPKGSPMRPAIYPFLEDIIAVDGKGGTRFRERLDQRYKASPPFRGMLHRVTMLWAVPQVMVAGGTLAGIVIADHELAYTVYCLDFKV